jgi:hypothetical protein
VASPAIMLLLCLSLVCSVCAALFLHTADVGLKSSSGCGWAVGVECGCGWLVHACWLLLDSLGAGHIVWVLNGYLTRSVVGQGSKVQPRFEGFWLRLSAYGHVQGGLMGRVCALCEADQRHACLLGARGTRTDDTVCLEQHFPKHLCMAD